MTSFFFARNTGSASLPCLKSVFWSLFLDDFSQHRILTRAKANAHLLKTVTKSTAANFPGPDDVPRHVQGNH